MQCNPKPLHFTDPTGIEHGRSEISTNFEEIQSVSHQIFRQHSYPLEKPIPLSGRIKTEIKKKIKKQKVIVASKALLHPFSRKKFLMAKMYPPSTPYNTTEYICYNQSFSRMNEYPSKTSFYPTLVDFDPLASFVPHSLFALSNSSSVEPTETDEFSNSLLDFKQ